MSIVKLQNMRLILIVVNANEAKAKAVADYLGGFPGNEIEFVDDNLAAYIRLSRPGHGYKFVLFGDKPAQFIYPDAARQEICKNLELTA